MHASTLVGRAREREAMAAGLAALGTGAGQTLSLEGEAGIGKSRLLAHLAEAAEAAGFTVLQARASEFESDLPYALFAEAIDPYVAADDRRAARLTPADRAALARAVPSLADSDTAPVDRHHTHRALRELLERLAGGRPLVLLLDDVHWADPASVDALAALVRRPPAARVLLAVAAREGQVPAPLARALDSALAEGRVIALDPGPLNEAEAAALIGDTASQLFARSGGNPFYLEQLARASDGGAAELGGDGSVPAAVNAALGGELAVLTVAAGRLLDAAAVAGDPFDLDLAEEVAELSDAAALSALDELLSRTLVRATTAPRRFAFRHPIVRHAVYLATPIGWRLGAHARAAEALEGRGAGVIVRAHHVQYSARAGDAQAIDLLAAAADELHASAPATSARFAAAALRVLPEAGERRTALRSRLADALAASGDASGARATLLEALQDAPAGERLALTVALANQDWWLGGHADARRRLHVALSDLPAQPSPDRVRLRLALALTAITACDLHDTLAQTSDARDDARAVGDRVFEAAALACGALAVAADADPSATERVREAEAALERLTPAEQATRLPAFWMLGRARRGLGAFASALAALERGAAIAAGTGRERVQLMLTVESVATLIALGRITDASAAGQDGLERARLSNVPRMVLWAHSALSSACLASGDVSGALRHAREGVVVGAETDFNAAGQPAWCLGAALTAAGEPKRAVEALLEATPLPVDRPAFAEDLVEARLALGDVDGAKAALAAGEVAAEQARTPWAAAVTGLARSAVLLACDEPEAALTAAVAAREAAADAPLTGARACLAEGRALAAAGRRPEAIDALTTAEAAFDRFGALRLRDEAVRELRRLGRRVQRPAREAASGALTGREREIAALVADGRTNREIAEQLVLSTRTIDAHLRNIYAKLGVRSRVELVASLR